MLAALTGAVAASRLGIAGTIIGTAFMSLASTVGASFYKHYITSSRRRLRAAASGLAPWASQAAVASAVARHHAAEGAQQTGVAETRVDATQVDRTQRFVVREFGAAAPEPARDYVSPDAAETQVIPPLHMNGNLAATRISDAEPDATVTVREVGLMGQGGGAGGAAGAGGARGPERPEQTTGAEPTGSAGADGAGGAFGAGGAGRGRDKDWTWPWSRRQWIMVAGTALGVFVIAMAAVTVFEAAVGKPLDAVVWHKHASGTTLGGLVGGSGGHHPRPGHSPSPSHSPRSSHSARPSHTPSSSPSPNTSSTAPTPSTSPTPSSSTTPSTGASTPAATNSAPAQTAAPGASSPSG
jgi:hypothetical protein